MKEEKEFSDKINNLEKAKKTLATTLDEVKAALMAPAAVAARNHQFLQKFPFLDPNGKEK